TMRRLGYVLSAIAAAAFALAITGHPANAWTMPCDFLTGGGFIVTSGSGAHAEDTAALGIGGGCKDGAPTWGHLEYQDHGNGLNVHGTSITAYLLEGPTGDTATDPQTGQPTGTRLVCGTADTNLYGAVDFMVRAKDAGEPGT